MPLTDFKAAVLELEKAMPEQTVLLLNRLDLSIQKAVVSLDELLTKHEANLGAFLQEHKVSVTITFEKK